MPQFVRMLCVAGVGSLMAGTALADSRCGASYAIKDGDTLYRVSQKCDVTLSRIMDLNPRLDPRDLSIGAEVRLTENTDDGDNAGRPRSDEGSVRARAEADGGYRIEPGDTMYSIAQALGISLVELMHANEDVNPFSLVVGNLLNVPGENERGGAVRVRPAAAEAGETVTVRAYNLRPGDWVTIGAGPMDSEWRRIREARVNSDGSLVAEVMVPKWADPGDDLIFVVNTDRGVTYKSRTFDVVAKDGRDDRERDNRERTLEGHVSMGTECHILRTPDGDRWSLVSDGVEFTEGEYVKVTGPRADYSKCMQGIGTIDVELMSEVDRPNSDDGMTLEGRVGRGAECYTLKTPDGDIWSLASSDVKFTEGEYVEVTGDRADVSYCMQGVGTLNVERIKEVKPSKD